MRIFLKEDAVQVAVHQPSPIPAHWQAKVKEDIERDIRLGVLERVPLNTPVTLCSRMHIVAKKNGEPRRVVDMQPVNAASKRLPIMSSHHMLRPGAFHYTPFGSPVMRGMGTIRCQWMCMTAT